MPARLQINRVSSEILAVTAIISILWPVGELASFARIVAAVSIPLISGMSRSVKM